MPIRKNEVEHSADHQMAKEDVKILKPQVNGADVSKESTVAAKGKTQTTGDSSPRSMASG